MRSAPLALGGAMAISSPWVGHGDHARLGWAMAITLALGGAMAITLALGGAMAITLADRGQKHNHPCTRLARRRRSAGAGGNGHHQAEADRHLTGRHHHHDQREVLPVLAAPHPRERHQRRFAPFSISSRQRRITSGLRRTSTPPAPMQKISAETVRYQPIAMTSGRHHQPPRPGRGRSRSARPRAERLRPGRAQAGGLGHRARVGRKWRRARTTAAHPAPRPRRRRASTTAPTAATSSRIEASSNGNRYLVRNNVPMRRGVPKPGMYGAPLGRPLQAGAQHRDAQLDGQSQREQRTQDRSTSPLASCSPPPM